MRLVLIACEVLHRELCACASRSTNVVDLRFLPKGLHDLGEKAMSKRLQEELDGIKPEGYDAILLGYGLCSNGICGLRAGRPLVAPRAQDCITLLLGSKERYLEYFQANPGTYFKSAGWIERGSSQEGLEVNHQLGLSRSFEELCRDYGEENARYLQETLGDGLRNYHKMAFIDTRVGDSEGYRRAVREEAAGRGWDFEDLAGDLGLLQSLLDGPWDEERFLTVPPGRTPAPAYGASVICCSDPRD